jgi:hypothetical protein
MKEVHYTHQKDEDSDPASSIGSLQQIRKYGQKQKQRPLYGDEASFMLDNENRAHFINTANRYCMETLFSASDIAAPRKDLLGNWKFSSMYKFHR